MSIRAKSTLARLVACAVLAGAVLFTAGPAVASSTATPAPPTNLRVTDLQALQFTVAWDPVPNAIEYQVRSQFAYPPWVTTPSTSATFNALWDTTYEMSVRVAVALDRSPWIAYSAFSAPLRLTTLIPPDFELPSAPRSLRVERDSRGEITLIRWDPSAEGFGTLQYRLYIDSPPVPGFVTGGPVVWDTTTGLTSDPGQNLVGAGVHAPGQSITLWVTAIDAKRNESPRSNLVVLTCCPF